MKMFALTALLVVLVSGIWADTAMAADASFGADINSAYVWRGITFNDGAVIQPSLDVTTGGFGFNVWGNIDIDDDNGTLDRQRIFRSRSDTLFIALILNRFLCPLDI